MNTIDWQTVANIATSIAVILALAVFVWEMRNSRREREYQVFFRYVDACLCQPKSDPLDHRKWTHLGLLC